MVISNDGLSVQSKDPKQWQGTRANRGVIKDPKSKSNKFYYEIFFTEPGLARVGWALANAHLDLGTDRLGWGYGGTGKKSNSRNFDSYGKTFGDRGDVIGCLLDLDNRRIAWTKNDEFLGDAFEIPNDLIKHSFYPCVCTKNAMCTGRFQASKSGTGL